MRVNRLVLEKASEIIGELLRGLITARWLLLQALEANRFEVARQAWSEQVRRERIVVRDLMQHIRQRLALERRTAGEQMIENRTERIHIAAPADRAALPFRLLRRNVIRRTQHLPAQREVGFSFKALGETEVCDVWLILRIDQHVGWFEIAMKNVALMREMDRFGNELEITRGLLR